MSFTNVGLGIVHSMAHPLSAFYDIPHGVANALILPYVLEFNADVCKEKIIELSYAFDKDFDSKGDWQKAAKHCCEIISSFNKAAGLPEVLSEIGVKEEDYDALAQSAFTDAATADNPKEVNVETFKNLYYSLQSVDEELKHIRDTHSNDALDLDSLQNRQYLIKKLYRKYGGSYMSLMESKKNIMDKIGRIIHRQDVFDKLEKEKEESFAAYMKLANELSVKRKAVFSLLESKVMEHCKDLMLENARFKISCTEKKPSSNGIDEIEFLVSMNPGQDFSSLSVSASGGELSRLMLALKVVFQASNGIETIIFDEIDTGVSGKVALAMGAKMKALSNKYQVLCITHLASVAVMANTHYLVSKKSTFNETITRVQKLDHDQTIQELAIMTSGECNCT